MLLYVIMCWRNIAHMEQLNFRIDKKDKDALEKLAKNKKNELGYTITVADVIRKAIKDLIENNAKTGKK